MNSLIDNLIVEHSSCYKCGAVMATYVSVKVSKYDVAPALYPSVPLPFIRLLYCDNDYRVFCSRECLDAFVSGI